MSRIREVLRKANGQDWHENPRLTGLTPEVESELSLLSPRERIGFDTPQAYQSLSKRIERMSGQRESSDLTAARGALGETGVAPATSKGSAVASVKIPSEPLPEATETPAHPQPDLPPPATNEPGGVLNRLKRALGL